MTGDQVLLEWKAGARPYKQRNREYYTTIGAIVFLLAVILLFLKEWLLIAVMVALAFLAYALAAVPPEEVVYQITEKGLVVAGKLYLWENLARFWVTERWGQAMLVAEQKQGFPGQVALMLGEQDKQQVEEMVKKYIKLEQAEAGWADRAAGWLSRKIPLESS